MKPWNRKGFSVELVQWVCISTLAGEMVLDRNPSSPLLTKANLVLVQSWFNL